MILLGVIWRCQVGKVAEEFFGMDFSAQPAPAVSQQEKPTGMLSKALEFFGIDFGTKKEDKPAVAPPRPLPEPSPVDKIDIVFNKLIQAESKGVHADASGKLTTSSVGAEGITQLMPKTAKNPGFGIEPVKDKSEAEYRRVGKEYLTKLYEKFGDWEKALAAYNAGMSNVTKAIGKAERFGGDWKDHLPRKEETLPYITKIMGDSNG